MGFGLYAPSGHTRDVMLLPNCAQSALAAPIDAHSTSPAAATERLIITSRNDNRFCKSEVFTAIIQALTCRSHPSQGVGDIPGKMPTRRIRSGASRDESGLYPAPRDL